MLFDKKLNTTCMWSLSLDVPTRSNYPRFFTDSLISLVLASSKEPETLICGIFSMSGCCNKRALPFPVVPLQKRIYRTCPHALRLRSAHDLG